MCRSSNHSDDVNPIRPVSQPCRAARPPFLCILTCPRLAIAADYQTMWCALYLQVSVGRRSSHGMTAVQLARLRARRNNTDFNVMRYMNFVDPEENLEENAIRPGDRGNSTRDRPNVAWSQTVRSRTGESSTGRFVDSPNEVRRAEDPTWCALATNLHQLSELYAVAL